MSSKSSSGPATSNHSSEMLLLLMVLLVLLMPCCSVGAGAGAVVAVLPGTPRSVEELLARYPGQDDLISPRASVLAVEAGATELPCPLRSTQLGDPALLVLWYRSDQPKPVYSYDVRGGSPVHWVNTAILGDRATFLPSTSVLTVTRVREDDEGIYTCRLDFRSNPTLTYKVNLTVIAHGEVSGSVGPLTEGSTLKLMCRAEGGDPAPRLLWWEGDSLLRGGAGWGAEERVIITEGEGDELIKVSSTVSSTLVLAPLRRSDLHRNLTCSASNTNLTDPKQVTVSLDLHLAPHSVLIRAPPEPLVAGRRARFTCEARGARPPALLSWYLEDNRLDNTSSAEASESSSETVSRTQLYLQPQRRHHRQPLACVASQLGTELAPVTATEHLLVYYPPEVTLKPGRSVNLSAIAEGDDVYFECEVDASPPAYKIVWAHQDRRLHHNLTRGIILSNQSLVVQGVGRQHAGRYQCTASNIEGDGTSDTLNLTVQFSPVCSSPLWQYRGASLLEQLTVSCALDALPPLQAVTWTFNSTGESVRIAQDKVTLVERDSQVRYTLLTELDYGSLLCWGTNAVGKQKIPCGVQIFPAGRPDPPHNCSQFNLSVAAVGVRCSAGFDGGLTQIFVLELYEEAGKILLDNVTSDTPQLWSSGLPPSSSFRAVLYSTNSRGTSDVTALTVITLRDMAEKRTAAMLPAPRPPLPAATQSEDLSSLVVVGAGVALGLLFVLVLLLLVVRLRVSRGRRARDGNEQMDLGDGLGHGNGGDRTTKKETVGSVTVSVKGNKDTLEDNSVGPETKCEMLEDEEETPSGVVETSVGLKQIRHGIVQYQSDKIPRSSCQEKDVIRQFTYVNERAFFNSKCIEEDNVPEDFIAETTSVLARERKAAEFVRGNLDQRSLNALPHGCCYDEHNTDFTSSLAGTGLSRPPSLPRTESFCSHERLSSTSPRSTDPPSPAPPTRGSKVFSGLGSKDNLNQDWYLLQSLASNDRFHNGGLNVYPHDKNSRQSHTFSEIRNRSGGKPVLEEWRNVNGLCSVVPHGRQYSKTLGRKTNKKDHYSSHEDDRQFGYFVQSLRELGYHVPNNLVQELTLGHHQTVNGSNDSFMRSLDDLRNKNLILDSANGNYISSETMFRNFPLSKNDFSKKFSSGNPKRGNLNSVKPFEASFSDDMNVSLYCKGGANNNPTSDVNALLDALIPPPLLRRDRESAV